MAERILAIDDNRVNLKVVSASLEKGGYKVGTAQSGPEALKIVNEFHPDLILLDINMPDMDGYEVCRRMRKMPDVAGTPIIMLTANDTLEEKIKGFEAGADDYLTKPFQPAELIARIGVLLRRAARVHQEQPTTNSKFSAVFSLRGGVGVSVMAANLAAGYHQIWGQRVVLVDMVLNMGQSALMLNLPLRNTWADLASIPPDEIDEELVQNVLLKHESGLFVLAAPRTSVEGETVHIDSIRRVLDVLRAKFSYVILDLPHDFSDVTLTGLDYADDVILMMAPELASVRATVGALEVFDTLGYSRNEIHVAMNWIFERKGLARGDIENVMKKKISFMIPYASESIVTSINLGVPPVLEAETSPVGALFEDIAYNISKEEDRENRPDEPTVAWRRVLARQKARQKRK
ncbi:MAG: response regulator [Anaerolineaceae bacterium]|nr:response regulator [Anaerolineaceae bacterium]